MKWTKIIIGSLYTLIVVCIGITTIIEKYHGTSFVSEHIYGAWWFSALWAVLTVTALAYIVKQRLYKRLAVLLLHLAFVVILAGALTTHLFAERGTILLRTGVPEITYVDDDQKVHPLPFALTLKEFRIVNYPGTDAPMDYQSVIQFIVHSSSTSEAAKPITQFKIQDDGEEVTISMNHPASVAGYRLFQKSYGSDGEGVMLGFNYDPWGIGITYAGYLLLLVGIIATLLSKKTQMRALYRKAITVALLLLCCSNTSAAASSTLPVIDKDIAHRMGTMLVLYNNRICPLNTVATDFAIKMTGSASWNGYSADEIFFSWMIYYMPWEKELLGLTPNPSPKGEGNFKGEGSSKEQKKAAERYAVVEMFYNGQFTKIFPYRIGDHVNWYSPGAQVMPREIPVKEQFFIKQSMDFLTEAIVTGQKDRAFEIIAKIKLFQRQNMGDLTPSETKIQAELFYNTLRTQKWPVFLALTLSLLLCIASLFWQKKIVHCSLYIVHCTLFLYVTLHLALRWWLSGHIPVSNGPETMLFMAWVLLLLPIIIGVKAILRRKQIIHSSLLTFHLMTAFTPLIASFCLLVAMLGGTSELTPLMPVLQSPLLSIHVMTVMCAYALFALQLLLGIYGLIVGRAAARSQLSTLNSQLERATALSQLFLYPAVFLLTIGIFLGAVWANVSWGNYWSWDPKETWALITLMIYAVPFHGASLPAFRRPRFYHLYMVLAFLSVVITYFGVNFLLGGMHSYA